MFADLNELVGLDKVKKVLHELVDVISLKEKASDLKIKEYIYECKYIYIIYYAYFTVNNKQKNATQ